jgi:hypothetical protein
MVTLATRLGLLDSVPVYGLKSTGVLTPISLTYANLISGYATPPLLSSIEDAVDSLGTEPYTGCESNGEISLYTCQSPAPFDYGGPYGQSTIGSHLSTEPDAAKMSGFSTCTDNRPVVCACRIIL